MVFAEELSTNAVVIALGAAGTFLGVVITAAVTGYKVWRKTRDESDLTMHSMRMQSDAASLSHFESVIRYLQGELVRGQADRERSAAHMGELQSAFDEMREENSQLRVHLEAMFGTTERLYDDACRRLREQGKAAEQIVEELGPRPSRPSQPSPGVAESRARELQQGTQALQAMAKRSGETLPEVDQVGGPP